MKSPDPRLPPFSQGRPIFLPVCPQSANRRRLPGFSAAATHSAWSWSFAQTFEILISKSKYHLDKFPQTY
jgi:hypothetical protein